MIQLIAFFTTCESAEASQVSKETAIREARGADSSRFGNALALSSASLHVSATTLARQNQGIDPSDEPLEPVPKEKKQPLADRLVDAFVAYCHVAQVSVSHMMATLQGVSSC